MSSSENSPKTNHIQSENQNNTENNNNAGFQQCHAHMLEKIMIRMENQSKEHELYMSELRKEC